VLVSGSLRQRIFPSPRPQLDVRALRQEGRRMRPAVQSAPAQIVRGVVPAPPIWDGVMETWFPILDTCLNIVQQLQVFPHRRSLNLVPAAKLCNSILTLKRLSHEMVSSRPNRGCGQFLYFLAVQIILYHKKVFSRVYCEFTLA
jgi:hypothetical protein